MVAPLSPSKFFDSHSIRIYLDRILAESGNPRNPSQRMLIEQMALSHLHLADIRSKAMLAKSPKEIKLFNGLCIKYMAEMRKIATTLDPLENKGQSAPSVRILTSG